MELTGNLKKIIYISCFLVGIACLKKNIPVLESRVDLKEIKIGSGELASPGMKLEVHYTGWLVNGKKFDSSRDRGKPFIFTLGAGQVIKGWDEGVPGMRVGGIRRLTIPTYLAYGKAGRPPVIPPESNLIFEIELLAIHK
jgi:FKBP-type peptidyl-prolyl cis-trans isomerase